MSTSIAASDGSSAPRAPISPALDFFAGTVAGVASLLTGHPFDTIKVRLQTQPASTAFVPSFVSSPLASTSISPRPLYPSPAAERHHVGSTPYATSSTWTTTTLRSTSSPDPFDRAGSPRKRLDQKGEARRYRNAWHACTRILREEGVSGLYKGVTSPMLGIALMNASVFTSYKLAMSHVLLSDPDDEPTLDKIAVAGALSGIFTSVLTTPIERLKILQQSHLPPDPASSSPSSSSSSSSRTSRSLAAHHQPQPPRLWTLVKTHSIRSLYRGFTPTVLRDTAYGPYFVVYEYVVRGGNFGLDGFVNSFSSSSSSSRHRRNEVDQEEGGESMSRKSTTTRRRLKGDLRQELDEELWGSSSSTTTTDGGRTKFEEGNEPVDPRRILVAGGLAGIAGWGITFPIDVLKTKMQSTTIPTSSSSSSSSCPDSDRTNRYRTLRSTFVSSWRERGWRGFVAGLGPTLVRSVPVNMTIETLVEKGQFNGMSFCLTCMVQRPLRSKHSYATGRCVGRFDHYCPWVWNDVGINNHRQFLVFVGSLVFGVLVFIHLAFAYFWTPTAQTPPASSTCSVTSPSPLCVAASYDTFAIVVTTWAAVQLSWTIVLLVVQVWQVLKQVTTLEMSNLGRYGYMGGKPGISASSQHGFVAKHSTPSDHALNASGTAGDLDVSASDPSSLSHAPVPPGAESPRPGQAGGGGGGGAVKKVGGAFGFLLKLLGLDRFLLATRSSPALHHSSHHAHQRGGGATTPDENPFDLGYRRNCLDFWTRGGQVGVRYEVPGWEIPPGGFKARVRDRATGGGRGHDVEARHASAGASGNPGGGGGGGGGGKRGYERVALEEV
ncbi:hypothetical protein JCM10212_001858 [Sporobolomyces blumeae]